MKGLKKLFLVCAVMFIVSCSASTPQDQLADIDELMNKEFPMSPEQSEGVTANLAEGKRLLSEGKEKEASEALKKAIDILHLAEDAYIFNKAD